MDKILLGLITGLTSFLTPSVILCTLALYIANESWGNSIKQWRRNILLLSILLCLSIPIFVFYFQRQIANLGTFDFPLLNEFIRYIIFCKIIYLIMFTLHLFDANKTLSKFTRPILYLTGILFFTILFITNTFKSFSPLLGMVLIESTNSNVIPIVFSFAFGHALILYLIFRLTVKFYISINQQKWWNIGLKILVPLLLFDSILSIFQYFD